MASLTARELAGYRDEGWVKPAFRLPAARVAAMRQALDELIARNPGVRPEKLVSAHVEGDNGEGVRGSAAFLQLALDPDIVELEPGEMSLHDVYMIHGARANTSNQRRTGVALRYMPATSHFDRSLKPVDGKSGVPVNFARRPLWLVRGVDRSGRNDFETGH
jgi:hypothetical protein